MFLFQVVLTISQTMWCQEVTEILESTGDPMTPEDGLKAFEQISFSRLNGLAALVRTNLPRLHRNNITALITVDVHARDIITDMVILWKIVLFELLFKRFWKVFVEKLKNWKNTDILLAESMKIKLFEYSPFNFLNKILGENGG